MTARTVSGILTPLECRPIVQRSTTTNAPEKPRRPECEFHLTFGAFPTMDSIGAESKGNNRERRRNHENQLPELYLARIIKAISNAGDLVSPFAGSGTTGTVARALQRAVNWDPN